jgi:hypothetical protein
MNLFRPNDKVVCVIPRIGLARGIYCVHAVSHATPNGEHFVYLSEQALDCGDGHSSTRFRLLHRCPEVRNER